MKRVFISYKRQDKDIVFSIVDEIKQVTGVDCWIDLEGIESGDQFQNVIIDAIDNSDIVIFMLSKNFIAPYIDDLTGNVDLKRQTFPEKEVMYALRHNKRLIPISIDGTTVYDCKWLEFNCSGLDCITWREVDQKQKLLNNLSQWVGNKDTGRIIEDRHNSSSIETKPIEDVPDASTLGILDVISNIECTIYDSSHKRIGDVPCDTHSKFELKAGIHSLEVCSVNQVTKRISIKITPNEVEELSLCFKKPDKKTLWSRIGLAVIVISITAFCTLYSWRPDPETYLPNDEKEEFFPPTYSQAQKCIDEKDYKKAEMYLRITIENYPDYTSAYVWLAAILIESGEHEEASKMLDKALELNPTHEWALNMKSKIN